jgi:gluconokinase
MGVSGAGKTAIGTRLAAALGLDWLDGDDLHPPENRARMAAGLPLDDAHRRPWLAAIAARLAAARTGNAGLVVACSALKRAYRDQLRAGDPALTFVHLTGDPARIAERLAARTGHFMPPSLLDSQLATLEVPGADEGAWTVDIAEPPEVIVDAIVRRWRA